MPRSQQLLLEQEPDTSSSRRVQKPTKVKWLSNFCCRTVDSLAWLQVILKHQQNIFPRKKLINRILITKNSREIIVKCFSIRLDVATRDPRVESSSGNVESKTDYWNIFAITSSDACCCVYVSFTTDCCSSASKHILSWPQHLFRDHSWCLSHVNQWSYYRMAKFKSAESP